MDDSGQDFADLCSRLLKRVRKKAGEADRQTKTSEKQCCSQEDQRRRRRRGENNQDGDSEWRCAASQPVGTRAEQVTISGRRCESGDVESSALPSDEAQTDSDLRAKDKVLLRMQHFKRDNPRKMVHNGEIKPSNQDSCGLTAQPQKQETPASTCSGLPTEPTESDEALALRLQQQLDREAAEIQTVDLEDGGLFFCQICNRNLTHMTPEGRTQHLNRCLDESEESGPAPPPPSAVLDCPICGKKFKSPKSRLAHLKRCSSEMGVSPAVLLQVLQRQAQESQIAAAAGLGRPNVNKRKGLSKSSVPARKKPRKKTEALDEETMVALALSSSMVEQEKKKQKEQEAERCLQNEDAAPHSALIPLMKWRPDAGKGHGKKKKVPVPRCPPLLLVQDAETALARLQERVSALLLRGRAPSPPTPTRCPSTLPSWTGAAPLWQKSALLDGDAWRSDFYAAELKRFFTSLEDVKSDEVSSSTSKKPESSVQHGSGGTPASICPPCSQTASCSSAPSTPGTAQLPVGSQTLRDLMDLAEDGMTLTQYGYTKENRLSGFIQEDSEDPAERCVSGFLVKSTHEPSDDACSLAARTADHSGTDKEKNNYKSVALSRLASDLNSMVNNPQLSDVQLQVDSGEVFFAHSFMVYTRCPLLAEMVHESGFGVQEEGVPAAQRVLLSDVPGQAVFSLLQYLYTSHCSIPASLQPHMLELASRFDLHELEQLCHLKQEKAAAGEDQVLDTNQEEHVNKQMDQAFMELLQSMWNEDDEDNTDSDGEGGRMEKDQQANEVTSDDKELHEEQVNEEELEEIYVFAATQRKKEEKDSDEEDEHEKMDKEHGGDADSSYRSLFSDSWGVYDDGDHASLASKSDSTETHSLHSKHQEASSKQSARTLLQSPASLIEDFPISPRPVISNLPVTGPSPAQGGDQEDEDAAEPELPLKGESPQSFCIPISPDLPQTHVNPELIVLSDSSEEGDVLSPSGLLVCSPLQSYTEIKSRQDQTPRVATLKNQELRSLELSPGNPPDCSPEISWLIPSTPLQSSSRTSSRTSSTQTKSSMCRTQLFPKRDSSSGLSSPALPVKKIHNVTKNSGVFASCASSLTLDGSSKQDPLLHLQNQLYSSTPLHKELHQPPVPPAPSPLLHTVADKENSSSQRTERRPSASLEETEFHLSPLSNHSDPPSSSSHSRRRQSETQSESSNRSPAESSGVHNARDGFKRTGGGSEQEEKEVDHSNEEETADVGESSFQLSFMDEPPIAFNDSWGLDVCIDANPGCFSLRLEDSSELNLQESNSGRGETSRSSASSTSKPPSGDGIQTGPSSTPPLPDPNTQVTPQTDNRLLDSKLWDSWGEDEEEDALPLSQRVTAQLKTPAPLKKGRRPAVPITPMPHYSDMDTPELKNKLSRFGVRALPKRQMIFKLKEIHQYTHQLASSGSEDEVPQKKPPPRRPTSCAQTGKFKEPRAPAATSPIKDKREEDGEQLSASQGSNTSSTASEESERYNPEQVLSSDGDSDSDVGISSSQTASRLQAVRAFILSNSNLYNKILEYQPLVLSQFQAQLKEAGIRLGAAKLVDYLDSQCITFTTAKPGQSGWRGKRKTKRAQGAGGKNGALKR